MIIIGRIKVIKSVIYGVKSSGNQAERALRLLVEMLHDKYPLAYDVVMRDVYVDDCISGEDTEEERDATTNQLSQCLPHGGFTLKGFTFSGEDPKDDLSEDGVSIMVGGLRYFPKGDFWMLNTGKLTETVAKIVLEKLTMRDCASVSAHIFDPPGRAVPIIAGIKLDISDLHKLGLEWDSLIPENLKGVWSDNLEMLEALGTLTILLGLREYS